MSEYQKHMPIIENDYDDEDFVFVQENVRLKDKVYKQTSFLRDVWNNFSKNKGAVVGLVIISIIIIFAIIGPMISGYRYDQIITAEQSMPPRIPGLEKLGLFNGFERGENIYLKKGLAEKEGSR